ncbi:hypothetical protein KIL84_007132 [Mauremys mutica]|uniref:Uncharacterized protein n=1 Tax=Mauremys mutica TaxID=74926 RepID=A0A9D3X0J3_9SAUR|nr:hypothetical protein KIL84_007132 [Mauremys mutica]
MLQPAPKKMGCSKPHPPPKNTMGCSNPLLNKLGWSKPHSPHRKGKGGEAGAPFPPHVLALAPCCCHVCIIYFNGVFAFLLNYCNKDSWETSSPGPAPPPPLGGPWGRLGTGAP